MRQGDRDQLSEQVIEEWSAFQEALTGGGRYPKAQFHSFGGSVRKYLAVTGSGPMVHRAVASILNGLVDYLRLARRNTPSDILFEAERLECQFFAGYDPHFEGDEPPGL